MARSTPAPAAAPAATVALTPAAATVAAILSALSAESTPDNATAVVHSALRTVRVGKDRDAVAAAMFAKVADIPAALLPAVVAAITTAPFGKDPAVGAAEKLAAVIRSNYALTVAAVAAGVALPTLSDPTPDELAAATATVARWMDGRGGGNGTKVQHPPRLLPKGTYSHRYESGAVVTCESDGKTPDRVTYCGESLSLSTAANRAAAANGTEKPSENGWLYWKNSAGATAASVGKVIG